MKLSAILEPMIAAGVSGDVILATVRAFEGQAETIAEEGKEKARERWRRWKNKQGTNVGKRLQTATNDSREGDARVEDNLPTKKISGQEERKKETAPAALSDLSAFKTDLERDATPEQVDAFAKHRKAKKGQNSAYAAKLFRRDAEACGLSVSQAIDTAISRGWLTVKPEYLAGRNAPPRQSTSPPRSERTVSDVLGEMAAGTWKPPGADHEPDFPTIETSFHRRN